MFENINTQPVTIDEARLTIHQLLLALVETQRIAIERGNELIELKGLRVRHVTRTPFKIDVD
ncbi:MAG: hypothetical protein ACPG4X_14780 [Pikeienuella sp.]